MLIKIKKMKNTNTLVSKTFSLIIFLYLTNNLAEEGEKLIPFLQQYNLTLERIKGKGHRQLMPKFSISYKNANFVARSHQALSLEDCVLLSQFLVSKGIVLAFFYNGQIFSVSRLKSLQKNLCEFIEPSQVNIYPFHTLWKYFYEQNF